MIGQYSIIIKDIIEGRLFFQMKNTNQCLEQKVKQKKCCKNCVKGKATGFSQEVLCWEKGIVSEDYYCSSHRFFVKDERENPKLLRCSNCEFFIIHPNDYIDTYGVCDLFSVRKCDGSIKKACSKFVQRKKKVC